MKIDIKLNVHYISNLILSHFDSLALLSAMGQIMLYVDGMNGVIGHAETIQWLYALVGSKVLYVDML